MKTVTISMTVVFGIFTIISIVKGNSEVYVVGWGIVSHIWWAAYIILCGIEDMLEKQN